MSDSLQPHRLHSPWNSPGQDTAVGSRSLLQGIFPTQGSNPGLPHCRQILSRLSRQGSPRILEWVASSFPSGSSRLRYRTGVSSIAGGFFTNWAIRELPSSVCRFQAAWGLHARGQQTVTFPRRLGVSVSRLTLEPDTNRLKLKGWRHMARESCIQKRVGAAGYTSIRQKGRY